MQANILYDTIRRGMSRRLPPIRSAAPLVGVLVLLVVWQLVTMLDLYPEFIIPSPLAVLERFIDVLRDGSLWLHTRTTLGQMLMGLGIGVIVGMSLGYAMAKSRLLEDALAPVVLAFQSTPVVAYAPLLVIWFSNGPTSKVITSALVVFFPILMNTIVGVRAVPSSLRDLMLSLRATRWQMFTKLELPSALPVLFGGLKVSATLAVIGAVVGEFVSPDTGLGSLILRAGHAYDTPLVVVSIITLAIIARVLYGVVALLERRALAWRSRIRGK